MNKFKTQIYVKKLYTYISIFLIYQEPYIVQQTYTLIVISKNHRAADKIYEKENEKKLKKEKYFGL